MKSLENHLQSGQVTNTGELEGLSAEPKASRGHVSSAILWGLQFLATQNARTYLLISQCDRFFFPLWVGKTGGFILSSAYRVTNMGSLLSEAYNTYLLGGPNGSPC